MQKKKNCLQKKIIANIINYCHYYNCLYIIHIECEILLEIRADSQYAFNMVFHNKHFANQS